MAIALVSELRYGEYDWSEVWRVVVSVMSSKRGVDV